LTDEGNLEGFVQLFEAQLSMAEVPIEDWKAILVGQLDTTPRLKVAGLVADADSSYDDIVRALRKSDGETSMSAAQRYFSAEPDLSKFDDAQKCMGVISQWSQKITENCRTRDEVLAAMDRARMRSWLAAPLRAYVDSKVVTSTAQMLATISEWKANTYDELSVFPRPGGRRFTVGTQGKTVRKIGECFLCGKPGHFAKECRSAGKGST